uniref:Cytochrome c oxidase subunit 3 n=1 Tax=Rhipiphorothrips cruentatus TaxID=764491 RepID=A0A8A5L648_9NEOP|nr:cytochrome c oxidase subunit 3 [Rhipiphorothrips cruentatus]
MKLKFFHPFHLVSVSPWPILGALSVFNLTFSTANLFNYYNQSQMILLSTLTTLMIMFQWWRDVIRESTFEGSHTKEVFQGMKIGMILFITSEVFFFISFFWAFFHSSLSPDIFIGVSWPPKGILSFNPMGIPLLNTLILISSGISVTFSHHSLILNKKTQMESSLFLTCLLGLYFLSLQLLEYKTSSFSISDSIYGTIFFMATGFHGLHVLIGTLFLLICFKRSLNSQFSSMHHFGFEAAAWYWHFVDVVWLYLYLFVYWWKF